MTALPADIVEAVARALCDAITEDGGLGWEHWRDTAQEAVRSLPLAAIRVITGAAVAMPNEATEEMLDAQTNALLDAPNVWLARRASYRALLTASPWASEATPQPRTERRWKRNIVIANRDPTPEWLETAEDALRKIAQDDDGGYSAADTAKEALIAIAADRGSPDPDVARRARAAAKEDKS